MCAGLLTSGLLPCMRHAIQNLMTDDMVVLPAAATVYVQAVEIRISNVCGVDLSPTNQHRWHPSHLSGLPQWGKGALSDSSKAIATLSTKGDRVLQLFLV